MWSSRLRCSWPKPKQNPRQPEGGISHKKHKRHERGSLLLCLLCSLWLVSSFRLIRQPCMHNKPFLRGANVIKRIAGDQRQYRAADISQNGALVRRYDVHGLDDVLITSGGRDDPDFVAGFQFAEAAKKRVPMCR